MDPISTLLGEHRRIVGALANMEALARGLRSGAPLDQAQVAGMVEFAREFVDNLHHRKEEPCLFDAVAARGLPQGGFPIGVLHAEHHQGRTYTARMLSALPRAASGDTRARRDLVRAMYAFIRLLREHIPKEERTLFTIARASLGEAEMKRLESVFAAFPSDSYRSV